MPLKVENQPLKDLSLISDFSLSYPQFKSDSEQLKASETLKVDPLAPYLYVHQLEVASVSANDSRINMIGLDGMTTCCAVVLRHTGSSAMAAGHFDGLDVENGLRKMIQGVVRLTTDWQQQSKNQTSSTDHGSNKYEVYIVGGFEDVEGISKRVAMRVLKILNKSNLDLHIKTACICSMNTIYQENKPLPCVTGLLCDVKKGQISPASFSFRGPLEEIRRLRFGMRGPTRMYDVYNSQTETLEIEPYNCTISDEMLSEWLAMDSKKFLANLSTSPEAESPSYTSELKEALMFLRDNRGAFDQTYKMTRLTDGRWKLSGT